jgi:hypothetical protein
MDRFSEQNLLFYLLSAGVLFWCLALSLYLTIVDSRRRSASLGDLIASFGALLSDLGMRLRQKGQRERERSASAS